MAATELDPGNAYAARRWLVHLGLMTSFAVAVVVILARMGVGLHILAGLAFAGLIGTHLVQRRRTVHALTGSLTRPPTWRTRRGHLALADSLLAFLAVNVVLSGVADWASPRPVMIGLPGMAPLNWHTTTSLLLIVYLPVHVVRRRARLRHSRIR
jgi:hypothetical protein